MRSVNKVILIGNLTRDPETRTTDSGQQVTTFGLATNREWMTREGDKKNSAEYHECVAWARLAEICGKYLKKGKFIYVEGYLKTRSWDTPEGMKKFKTEVIVQDMIMLEKRPKDDGLEYAPETDIAIDDEIPEAEEKAPEKTEEPKVKKEKKAPKEETPEEGESIVDKDLGL